ncbi:MAG: aminotransferase class I/II-fold pyridoxal phosphate-dependent enzyme [Pontiellaceae bacterium]
MDYHPLIENPLYRVDDLGKPIPENVHAVSMCLPRWEDIIGYEERDPATLQALQLGYPRFLIHPYVLQLAKNLNPDPDRDALPFPTAAGANRHCSFLQQQHSNEAIDVVERNQIYLVIYPTLCGDTARAGWQLLGEGLTSRHAEALLNVESFPDPKPIATKIRHQLAAYTQTDPNQIVLFPNGMAALHAALRALQKLQPSKGFAQFGFPYGDTLKLLEHLNTALTRFYPCGDPQDLSHLKADLAAQPMAGIFTEFPSNPLLNCIDLESLRAVADRHACPIVLDETLGGCVNLDTHAYADISAISLTKYFSGHGDVMGGALLINPDRSFAHPLLEDLQKAEQESYLFAGDLEKLNQQASDLPERMRLINRNAIEIATYLEEHPAVEQVWHPSLEDKERYNRYARSEASYGGVLSFTLEFPEENTIPFYDKLACCKGPNLGTVFTLCCPFVMLAHYNELDWAEDAGVSRWLIRLSVGTEPVQDLIKRIENALT